MKKLILLLFLSSIVTTGIHAQVNPQLSNRLDVIFDSVCNRFNIKGATAAVHVPNQGTWERAHGVSHGNTPITTNMYMGIGSNTKTYFSVLMLLLQEQGKLDLDDTIGTWISHQHVPGNITIRQMLNHTSGLYSYTSNNDINNYILADFTRVWPPDSIFNLLKAPTGTPGGAWDYSNTNYLIAGVIIEKVTGKKPYTVLRDEILTPQGLTETFFYPYETPTGTIPHAWSANLHMGNDQQDLIAVHSYSHNAMFSLAYTAGAIMATAKDNALFWDKLMSGNILNSSSMAELQTYIPNISTNTDYGLGLFRFRYYNARNVVSHGGTNVGFINENVHDLTSGVSLTVLTNQDSSHNGILLNYVLRAMHRATVQYTGVEETIATNNNIKIYPNPAKNIVHIGINEQTGKAVMYDMSGRMVAEKQLSMGDNTLQVDNLSSGSYMLNIITDENIHNQILQVIK